MEHIVAWLYSRFANSEMEKSAEQIKQSLKQVIKPPNTVKLCPQVLRSHKEAWQKPSHEFLRSWIFEEENKATIMTDVWTIFKMSNQKYKHLIRLTGMLMSLQKPWVRIDGLRA